MSWTCTAEEFPISLGNTSSSPAVSNTGLSILGGVVPNWRALLHPQLGELMRFSQLGDNWDSRGSLAPSLETVTKAIRFFTNFYDAFGQIDIPSDLLPDVGVSEDGEVVFEWWRGRNKLTIYIKEEGEQFVRSWGVNIFDEMEDGVLSDLSMPVGLWTWLVRG